MSNLRHSNCKKIFMKNDVFKSFRGKILLFEKRSCFENFTSFFIFSLFFLSLKSIKGNGKKGENLRHDL